jgi:hypothetical protein
MIGRKYIVKLRKDRMELTEELRSESNELITFFNIILPVLVLQVPFDLH